jgi:hypothetical protein
VSIEPRRLSGRPASNPTSLVGTAAQPHTLATGRVRVAAGAVVLVVAGVMLGAWGATRGRGTPPTASSMTIPAMTAATADPPPASVPPAEVAITTPPPALAVATTTAAAAPTTTPTPLAMPGRLRALTVPSPATPSASAAAATPPRADRFDHQ